MEKELKNFQTEIGMKDILRKESLMEMEASKAQRVINTQVSLEKEKKMALEYGIPLV